MADNSQIARLQNGIRELQQDLQANQKELTSKTKRIIEFENLVSKLQKTIQIKNEAIDELQIKTKLNAAHKNDEMHLKMEEYKNEISESQNQYKRILNDYNSLQRQHNNLQLQFKSMENKYKTHETQFNNKLQRDTNMLKIQMQSMSKMHSSKIQIYKDKMDLMKKNQMAFKSQENESIKQSLIELQQSHDRIERDLQQQIEDMRDIMSKRAKEEESNIREITDHYNEYKTYAENQISLLEQKLGRFQDGEVEIVLKIEVDDPILHKPPPKKPAPVPPMQGVRSLSRRSSDASSHASDASGKLKQLLSLPKLFDVQSNPELYEITDASHPHHQISASMGDSGMMKDMKKFVRHAFTPKPSMTSRYGQGSGGFPNTTRNGMMRSQTMRNKPRTLSVLSAGSSSISSQSQKSVFSDNFSVASSGYTDMKNGRNGSNLSRNMQLRYVKQNNTRLAEENKLLQKKIMFSKEQAHRKYKQLNTQIIAEKKQWKLKESELTSKIHELNLKQKENEVLLTERYKKLQALAAEYKMVVNQHPELTQHMQNRYNNKNHRNNDNQNMNQLILKVQSLEENNANLAKQCEKYRRDLGGLKATIISCNDTMKKQQQSILIANNQIKELRRMNGFSGSSSEELLQKQIRLLKNQRRMLVQELKDLREQNEKLKNIIVTGSPT